MKCTKLRITNGYETGISTSNLLLIFREREKKKKKRRRRKSLFTKNSQSSEE
jgi:hypothetical protein